jgi:hypothetical protein
MSNTFTRRAIIAAVPALAAAAAVPAAADTGDDAELIALCGWYLAESDRINADPATRGMSDDEIAAECDRLNVPLPRINELPATTLAGIAAKIEVLRELQGDRRVDVDGEAPSGLSGDMAFSLFRDARRIGGAS